jgi:hypothetical protein
MMAKRVSGREIGAGKSAGAPRGTVKRRNDGGPIRPVSGPQNHVVLKEIFHTRWPHYSQFCSSAGKLPLRMNEPRFFQPQAVSELKSFISACLILETYHDDSEIKNKKVIAEICRMEELPEQIFLNFIFLQVND